MKKYIDAKLQIVRTDNCDIVTTSIKVGSTSVTNSSDIQAPDRRSIWD
ncbi:MAG: hypothetical protein IKN59_00855 [Paludibacteraceae bacterium]|nr:hypothetical protein [Paludibacteraceae bacterium]